MATTGGSQQPDKRPQSIFDLPEDFFDCCRLLPPAKLHHHPPSSSTEAALTSKQQLQEEIPEDDEILNDTCNFSDISMNTWSCNICKSEFDSLLDQRSHFKSDLHRFNVKLNLAGKVVLNEDDFDELASDSFSKDFDVSSISGSEDEDERGSRVRNNTRDMSVQSIKQKLCVHLQSGEKVSIWKCFLLKDNEDVSYENNQLVVVDDNGHVPDLKIIERLKSLTHEPRDNTHLRIVLLASGGHFAGCVFDGNTVITYKTFHRYVVRAKAGKRQSTKDASGRSIHSAGASLRRYNELALKKDIQELLASWKPYFDASSCVFIYAPSSNRQMFYNGEGPLFSNQQCDARNIPFSVRRPTLKEARRIYNQLSLVVYENEEELPDIKQIDLNVSCVSDANILKGVEREVKVIKEDEVSGSGKISDKESSSEEGDKEIGHTTTPLHEAAKSDNPEKVLELLEQGLDPTVKDERGKTPYMVATDKEVRNTFRRFMASNLEKWDWHAANVPSALTKEMEESQAAKQAEKDAKRKAKAKELKKQRKAREREKKAEVKAAESQKIATAAENKSTASRPVRTVQSVIAARLSKEEELKRKQIEEREKRAAAAERRLALAAAAAANAQGASSNPTTASSSQPKTNIGSTDTVCSCCNASLDIQELLASWKPYFDASSCVFIYAPSSNRQMFYNGEGPLFSNQQCDARNIPFSVRRPTLKEARRIYNQLSLVVYENEEELPDIKQIDLNVSCVSDANILKGVEREVKVIKEDEVSGSGKISDKESSSEEGDKEIGHTTTPLHEAAKSDNPEKVLELLEQGLDPTVKDERGKTPYMVATDKEVRNTFRRFMASNLEKWDWHAANVPSALTKEMEESQAAKQAEKDAKRKAKAKELKKQRKAREREKKAEVKAAESQKIATAAENKSTASRPVRTVQSVIAARLSKEEELKRKQIEEREKRAAAAERRLALAAAAAANAQGASSNPTTASSSQPKTNIGSTDTVCSCCNASLVGKVPFHRYNYKYCSTTCMQVHREFLEDG